MTAKLEKRLLEGGGEGSDAEVARRLLSRLGPFAAPGDAARERVWKKVASPAPARSPRRWALGLAVGAGTCALAALLVAPRLTHHDQPVRLFATVGHVQIAQPGREWASPEAGSALPSPLSIQTGDDGRAVLQMPGVAAILAQPGTRLAADRSRGVRLELGAGTVLAKVSPRPKDSPFSVETPRWSVRVVGTCFAVERLEDDQVAVTVWEGTVEVQGEAGSWAVHAGSRWDSRTREVHQGPALSPDDRELLGHALERGSEVRGTISLPTSAVAARVPAPVPEPTKPAARAASYAADRPARAPIPSPREPAAPPVAPPPLAPVEALEPVEAAAPSSPPAAQPSAEASQYEAALALAAQGRSAEAASIFGVLADGRGEHAQLALYQLARLEQTRLSKTAAAIESLERYRREYPAGALSQEVDLSLIEARLAVGERDSALAETGRFLGAYPRSERAAEVHYLRGNMLRESNRCADALGDYTAALSGDHAFDDDALYFAGWCQHQLARDADSSNTLRAYLARFPAGKHRREAQAALGEGP